MLQDHRNIQDADGPTGWGSCMLHVLRAMMPIQITL